MYLGPRPRTVVVSAVKQDELCRWRIVRQRLAMRWWYQPVGPAMDHQNRTLEVPYDREIVERIANERPEQAVPSGQPSHTGKRGFQDQGGDRSLPYEGARRSASH